jgi:hypothetical protein
MTNSIEFNLASAAESLAFALLCGSLNQVGVPYRLLTDMAILCVTVVIGEGY